MLTKEIITHNPQDFFTGCEDPELSEVKTYDLDLPEPVSRPLIEGYYVILKEVEGRIALAFRKEEKRMPAWKRLYYRLKLWRWRRWHGPDET